MFEQEDVTPREAKIIDLILDQIPSEFLKEFSESNYEEKLEAINSSLSDMSIEIELCEDLCSEIISCTASPEDLTDSISRAKSEGYNQAIGDLTETIRELYGEQYIKSISLEEESFFQDSDEEMMEGNAMFYPEYY